MLVGCVCVCECVCVCVRTHVCESSESKSQIYILVDEIGKRYRDEHLPGKAVSM